MKKILLALTFCTVLATPAYAFRLSHGMEPNCVGGMQENVNINVNFSLNAASFPDAKKKFDEQVAKINEFAKSNSISAFALQSMNYNINAQGGSQNGTPQGGYQLSGNASYTLGSADNAFKMGEFLTKQGLQVSVNANSYRNAACLASPAATNGVEINTLHTKTEPATQQDK